MIDIWNLNTADMTLVELQEYKKELLRQEEVRRERRARNKRLTAYLIVLLLLIGGGITAFSLMSWGEPVSLAGSEFEDAELEDESELGQLRKVTDYSFVMQFYRIGDDITMGGEICREPEKINKYGKSTVTFEDGTRGTIRCKYKGGYIYVYVEYRGKTYKFCEYTG